MLIGLSQAWSCRGTLSSGRNSNFPEGQCRWWMDGSMKDQWILKLLLTYWPLRPLFSLSSLEKLWTPVRVSWQEQHLLSWLSHMLVRKLSPACLWATCCLLSFAGVILRVASFLLLPFFLFLLHRACAIRYSEPCFSETGSSACSCLTNSRSPLDRVAWRPIMHLEMGDIFLTTNQAKKKNKKSTNISSPDLKTFSDLSASSPLGLKVQVHVWDEVQEVVCWKGTSSQVFAVTNYWAEGWCEMLRVIWVVPPPTSLQSLIPLLILIWVYRIGLKVEQRLKCGTTAEPAMRGAVVVAAMFAVTFIAGKREVASQNRVRTLEFGFVRRSATISASMTL